MISNHERFEELIPIYALETLDGEELKELEEHLKTGCRVCEELLREQKRIKSFLPYSVMTPSPSPRVKDMLFKKLKTSAKFEERSYSPNLWERLQPIWLRFGSAVALGLLVLLFISNLSLRNRLSNQQAEIGKLREQAAYQSEITGLLGNTDVVVINLVGLQPDPKTHGRILWNRKENKAYFYGLNLPSIPSGKTYQLWAIADNTPLDIGVFKVDDKGNSLMKLESLPASATIQKFAVTLEPEGGVPQPTGQMYLIGGS